MAAAVEGYAFPTVMDTDPPVGGLAPDSMASVFWRCLDDGASAQDFEAQLAALLARKAGR